ncbi:MAG TPA: molybdate ABC transporter substrate-binding protein [Streptosporangiales bacterium]
MRLRALALVVALAALLAPVAACGKSGGSGQAKTTLTVLAAASLTNAFGEMKAAYAKDHPDVTLRFSFAGSQELAAQVRSGAPADVIATADEKTMTALSKYVVDPEPFVTNRLAIVVGKGNPKHITTLRDLARSDLKVVLAGPTVPAGRYARQILARAQVTVRPKSEPTDVRQVLTPVRLGEADAGIVYVTDIKDAGGSQVQAVSIPAKQNLIATYPVAAIKDSRHAAAAKAFAAWLRTEPATAILTEHGFGRPPK